MRKILMIAFVKIVSCGFLAANIPGVNFEKELTSHLREQLKQWDQSNMLQLPVVNITFEGFRNVDGNVSLLENYINKKTEIILVQEVASKEFGVKFNYVHGSPSAGTNLLLGGTIFLSSTKLEIATISSVNGSKVSANTMTTTPNDLIVDLAIKGNTTFLPDKPFHIRDDSEVMVVKWKSVILAMKLTNTTKNTINLLVDGEVRFENGAPVLPNILRLNRPGKSADPDSRRFIVSFIDCLSNEKIKSISAGSTVEVFIEIKPQHLQFPQKVRVAKFRFNANSQVMYEHEKVELDFKEKIVKDY